MLFPYKFWVAVVLVIGTLEAVSHTLSVEGRPHRILLDTDVDTDDFFALLYLLKLNRSEFELEVRKAIAVSSASRFVLFV